MTKRASLEETLEFCNEVREAGGTNALDALLPAVPQESESCLIAANLNFNCSVDGDGKGQWYMIIEPGYAAVDIDAIQEATGCEAGSAEQYAMAGYSDEAVLIKLPWGIGQVAKDFDQAWIEIEKLVEAYYDYNSRLADEDMEYEDLPFRDYVIQHHGGVDVDYQLIEDFWPYIEESMKETYDLGFINDQGKLVL